MSAITFDTLAEVQAETLAEIIEDKLTTKRDLQELDMLMVLTFLIHNLSDNLCTNALVVLIL